MGDLRRGKSTDAEGPAGSSGRAARRRGAGDVYCASRVSNYATTAEDVDRSADAILRTAAR
ncbi:hypothetical protein [Haloechinothrix salitolerans]|uniref:Uncharacterized protein n=1 Tax=Haloechinothrix salitolerans TaxID=926830 RepID=A0ABW2C0U6_9PSEU